MEFVEFNGEKIKIVGGILDLSGRLVKSLKEIEGLSSVTGIRKLILNNNYFSSIKEIGDYPNLKESLEELDYGMNNITEIEGLNDFINLKILKIPGNKIVSLKNFENFNLPNLEKLNLYQNKIEKIEGLNKCENLVELSLANNNITRIENVSHLKNLKNLGVQKNKINNLDNFSELLHLTRIVFEGNDMDDEEVRKIVANNGRYEQGVIYIGL